MEYLKSFIIGTSLIIWLPFFIKVKNSKTIKKYTYYEYTLLLPTLLGLLNVISLIIAKQFKLSRRLRFLVISIITIILLIVITKHFEIYQYTEDEWNNYYLNISLIYLFVWNIIIYNLEKYI